MTSTYAIARNTDANTRKTVCIVMETSVPPNVMTNAPQMNFWQDLIPVGMPV